MMGYSYSQDDGPVMCFNGAKSWQTGWYNPKRAIVTPSTGGCFEGNLYGIADFGNAASSIVLVQINDSTASNPDFYVAFNRQIGSNSQTQEAWNQVTVTRQAGGGTSYAESELMAKLGVGGTWSVNVNGKIMTVTVLSINVSNSPGFAQARISEGGNSCGPAPTKVPTSSPTSAPTAPTHAPTSASPTVTPTHSPTPAPVPTTPPSSTPSRTPTTKTPSRSPTTRSPTCIGFNRACNSGSNSCCSNRTCKLHQGSYKCR